MKPKQIIYQSVLSTASPNPGVSTIVSLNLTPPSFISIVEGLICIHKQEIILISIPIFASSTIQDECQMSYTLRVIKKVKPALGYGFCYKGKERREGGLINFLLQTGGGGADLRGSLVCLCQKRHN